MDYDSGQSLQASFMDLKTNLPTLLGPILTFCFDGELMSLSIIMKDLILASSICTYSIGGISVLTHDSFSSLLSHKLCPPTPRLHIKLLFSF